MYQVIIETRNDENMSKETVQDFCPTKAEAVKFIAKECEGVSQRTATIEVAARDNTEWKLDAIGYRVFVYYYPEM